MTAADLVEIPDFATADAYFEEQAPKWDALFPGFGAATLVAWSILRGHLAHEIGLAIAATSGAETEFDYYTDGGCQ